MRDSVLGEIPVAQLTPVSVAPLCSRAVRSRGPIAASASATSLPATTPYLPNVPLHTALSCKFARMARPIAYGDRRAG